VSVADVLRRWYQDDDGQDVVEYALLCSFVALAGVLGFRLLGTNMNTIFSGWDTAVWNQWIPSDPVP